MNRSQIEITGFVKSGGPLTKRIVVAADGSLHSDGSACVMSTGWAYRLRFDTLDGFAACIAALDSNEAIALGALGDEVADRVEVTTNDQLAALNGAAQPNVIARTGNHIFYRPDQPTLALIDYDTKGIPPAVRARMDELGGFLQALMLVLPELTAAGRVVRPSTSSGITRTDTGQAMAGSNGVHLFVLVQNGADVQRFLKTLHARCWLQGFGWMMVGAGGQLLERSIVDRTVAGPERLVFEAPPILEPPLEQDQGRRAPAVVHGNILDTWAACPDLTVVEQARLRELHAAEKARLRPKAATAHAAFVDQQAARIVKHFGQTLAAGRRIAERQCAGVLLPAVLLHFDATECEGATVGDVLADPDRFIGATLADPLEGLAYGRCKAKVMRRLDGTMWINSFAHGRTTYELNHDAASVETALRNGEPAEAADTFVKLLLAGDLAPDEEQRLRELASELSGVKARPLATKIKAALTEQKRQNIVAERERRAAARAGPRIKLPAPLPDAELLPIARAIDDVLHAAKLAEPPTRDLDIWPVEVRAREAFRLHGMTARDANQDDQPLSDERNERASPLPPPKMWLLTQHDKFSMEHLIEAHIEFVQETEETERSVALHPKFVEHYMHYRNSKLPIVGAVVTNPLVLADGILLAPDGLDRHRRVVFKIEPALRDLLPKREDSTDAAVARAMHFLLEEWLVDVATDFAGKCVLISAVMTILERTLLPERPAFFVTAGQRGGGKTTVLTMLFLAACGHTPPACAWSQQEEERRKALFSYLGEGVPAVVWDNIPRGSTISCPSIEKSLTSETYSDRVLGESRTRTVPAFTINLFTGNNIAPRGDMASRSLSARLAVGRPDPENREFKHPDPIAWTEAHRGNILRALYTVMLGNPRLRAENSGPADTRFKTWWHLIGSAIEHGAILMVEQIKWLTIDAPEEAPPTKISFRDMFNVFEADEEQSSALANVLDLLSTRWSQAFKAADPVTFVGDAREDSINFKAALELATGKPMPVVTATVITWRLKALVDAPAQVGDRVLVLRYTAERGHGGTFFVSNLG
jgi:hypothetical protein